MLTYVLVIAGTALGCAAIVWALMEQRAERRVRAAIFPYADELHAAKAELRVAQRALATPPYADVA